MAPRTHFSLYPIYWVALPHLGPEPFNADILPFHVVDGVNIERVTFREGAFEVHRRELGNEVFKALSRVQHALVHRYELDGTGIYMSSDVTHQESERVVRETAACLRLVRPMRQHAMFMHGEVREDGTFDPMGFDVPNLHIHEVPEVQKLWTLRNRDCEMLRAVAPGFLRAIKNEVWKFRMAAQFHELGFFQSNPEEWKGRLLLWASAVESIYTTSSREHQGTAVATERIKWFLGEQTSIYPAGDLSEFETDPEITVGDMVGALYEIRNFVAHGDRVPDIYFSKTLRNGINGAVAFREVLLEAQSFIVRATLLKIIRDGMLDHFKDAAAAEALFYANGLTNSQIRARQKAERNKQD